MMKVILVNDFEFEAGAEKVFRDTRELLSNQCEISCYIGSEYHKVSRNPIEYIYSFSERKRFFQALLNFSPEVIHIHVFSHLLTSSIFSAIKRYKQRVDPHVKVVYTAHDFNLICPNSGYMSYRSGVATSLTETPPSFWELMFMRLDKRSFAHSWLKKAQWVIGNKLVDIESVIDLIITPSHFLKNVLKQKIVDKTIKVIRNPIEFKSVPHVKNTFGTELKLVYFGRLSEEKGVCDFLIKVASSKTPFTMDIIGDGPEREKMASIIQREEFQGRIQLLDKMEHSVLMLHLAANYHAMVLPSIWFENAPLSLVEASRLGLAILGSNLGGIKEISDLCGNNFLFDPHSEIEVHDQLSRCATYLQSRSGEIRVLKEFDGEVYTEQLSEVYNGLIA